jgi:hypothetical protein
LLGRNRFAAISSELSLHQACLDETFHNKRQGKLFGGPSTANRYDFACHLGLGKSDDLPVDYGHDAVHHFGKTGLYG